MPLAYRAGVSRPPERNNRHDGRSAQSGVCGILSTPEVAVLVTLSVGFFEDSKARPMDDFAISSIRILQRLRRFVPQPVHRRWLDRYWERLFSAEAAELHRAEQERAERARAEGNTVPDPILAAPRELSGSERGTLIRAIADRYPFGSLLEVGCSFGQNFHLLARQYPRTVFVGLDNDAGRVAAGAQLLIERGLTNAVLVEGDMRNLSSFGDRSFDLVICSAALLYIAPEEIEAVLQSLWRLANRSLLLMEQVAAVGPGETAPDTYHPAAGGMPPHWQRDYGRLLGELAARQPGEGTQLTLTKVEAPRWPTERWKSAATLCVLDRR